MADYMSALDSECVEQSDGITREITDPVTADRSLGITVAALGRNDGADACG
jgi:hypothetical protein